MFKTKSLTFVFSNDQNIFPGIGSIWAEVALLGLFWHLLVWFLRLLRMNKNEHMTTCAPFGLRLFEYDYIIEGFNNNTVKPQRPVPWTTVKAALTTAPTCPPSEHLWCEVCVGADYGGSGYASLTPGLNPWPCTWIVMTRGLNSTHVLTRPPCDQIPGRCPPLLPAPLNTLQSPCHVWMVRYKMRYRRGWIMNKFRKATGRNAADTRDLWNIK